MLETFLRLPVDQPAKLTYHRIRAAAREIADLVGYDGKSSAGFAGPSRFHGGIQGQNIRLKRNLIDGFGNLLKSASNWRAYVRNPEDL